MTNHEPPLRPTPARRSNGARALANLGSFLAEDGWRPTPDGPTAFTVVYRGASSTFTMRAELLVSAEQLVITADAPSLVPPARRAAAAEYICLATAGLAVGSLDLDLTTGKARARCGIDFEGEPLSPRLVRNALAIATRLSETYLPGLASVAAGADPRETIRTIEGEPS